MREVGAQGQAQLVDGDRAAKIQRECGVRVTVDAPALVGLHAVGAVLVNAVDGVAGRKHSLAARFYVGAGVGIKTGVAMLVIAVEGQIPPRGNLLRVAKRARMIWQAPAKLLGL